MFKKVVVCAFSIYCISVVAEESSDFLEVDVRKVFKDSQVKFGSGIQRDLYQW